MGQSPISGLERLTEAQTQSVLDFMWLCAQVGDEAASASLRRLQAVLDDASTGPDELDEFLKQANAELRQAIHAAGGQLPERSDIDRGR